MARKSEKQTSRAGGNVRLTTVNHPAISTDPFDPMDGSEAMVNFLEKAREMIQRGVDDSASFTDQQIRDVLLVVLDGTSPIAPAAIRPFGKEKVGGRLLPRKAVIADFDASGMKISDAFRETLSTPAACGHLQYFASIGAASVVQCVKCDLDVTPSDEHGEPSMAS